MDSLTGLPSKEQLKARALGLSEEWAHKSNSDCGSVVVFDMDAFSRVNYSHGHQKGDEYLCIVSRTISSEAEYVSGSAFRLGGDEFAVVLPSVNLAQAKQFALSIQARIAKLTLPMGSATSGLIDVHQEHLTVGAALCTIHMPFYGDLFSIVENTHFASRTFKCTLAKESKNMAQVLVVMELKTYEP